MIDSYSIYARLTPALIVLLPAVFVFWMLFPKSDLLASSVWGLFTTLGGGILLSHLGRDLGKRKEKILFKSWSGKPSVVVQRYSYTTNRELLSERVRVIRSLFPQINYPSEELERDDPRKADEMYDSISEQIRARTRDAPRFNLLFKENRNYGFRRNLWGMKQIGLYTVILSLLIQVGFCIISGIIVCMSSPLNMIALALNLFMLSLWICCITPEWVKLVAFAYAERLIETVHELERSRNIRNT